MAKKESLFDKFIIEKTKDEDSFYNEEGNFGEFKNVKVPKRLKNIEVSSKKKTEEKQKVKKKDSKDNLKKISNKKNKEEINEFAEVVEKEESVWNETVEEKNKNKFIDKFKLIFFIVIIILIVIFCIIKCSNNNDNNSENNNVENNNPGAVLQSIEVDLPKIMFLEESINIVTSSSGTGDLSKVNYKFDVTDNSILKFENNSLIGKEVTNTLVPIKTGSTKVSISAFLGNMSDEKSKEIVVCKRLNEKSLNDLTLEVGKSINLSFDVGNSDLCKNNLKYEISNTKIVTVNNSGTLKAIKEGNAKLKVTDGKVVIEKNVIIKKETLSNETGEKPIIVTDKESPICKFSGPDKGSILKNNTAVYTLTCTDNVGIITTPNELKNKLKTTNGLSVTSVSRTGSKTNYTYKIIVKGTTIGSKKITLDKGIIKDESSNSNLGMYSNSLSVVGDVVAPVIEMNGNASGTSINKNGVVTIPIKIIEKETSITANDFKVSNITVKVGDKVISPSTKELKYNSVSNGVYSYTLTLKGLEGNGDLSLIIAKDSIKDKTGNGNSETTISSKVIVDNTAPVCTFAGPYETSSGTTVQNYTKAGGEVYYIVTCTDNVGITKGNLTNSQFNSSLIKNGKLATSTTRSGNLTKYIYTIKAIPDSTSYGEMSLGLNANLVKDEAGNGNKSTTSNETTTVYATLGSSSRGLYEPGPSLSTWSVKLNSYTVDPTTGKITYNATASLWLSNGAYNYDTRTYQVCLSRYGSSSSAGTCYTTAATYYTGWKGTGSSATWSGTVNITTKELPASGTYYYASSLRTDSGCCFGIGDTEGIVTTIYR